MQLLDLNAAEHAERESHKVGPPWSLLLIPVLFVAAAISVPFSLVAGRIQRRRELAFDDLMRKRGRVMEWATFREAFAEHRGTLLRERYSLKGPIRWWWTPENVYDTCPHPIVDWIDDWPMTPASTCASEWFFRRYTNPEDGRAFLVSIHTTTQDEVCSLRSQLESESGALRWIEIVAPANIRKR